jgi:hypothetical protein
VILPSTWTEIACPIPTGRAYRSANGLRVITTVATEQDGKAWLHVSVSRVQRLPGWLDLREVKDVFIGRDATALQVLPSSEKYRNQHPFCLHLWHCLDGEVVPDFLDDAGNL